MPKSAAKMTDDEILAEIVSGSVRCHVRQLILETSKQSYQARAISGLEACREELKGSEAIIKTIVAQLLVLVNKEWV